MSLDIKALSEHFDIKFKVSEQLSDRATLLIDTEANGKYVLKRKGTIESVEAELDLLKYLNERKVPVQLPNALDTNPVFKMNNEIYCVYKFVPGQTYTGLKCLSNPAVPLLIGEALAKLHREMRESPNADRFKDKDIYNMVYGFAVKEIEKVDDEKNLIDIYQNIESSINRVSKQLPKQLIHRDAHIFNMIFNENKISGIIDFEIAEVNVRVFDICYCCTSILNEVFKISDSRKLWIEFVGMLVNNYNLHNPLNEEEKGSIWYVMLAIQSIFMAFFINDLTLYSINKEMFTWIYNNKELIEFTIISKMRDEGSVS